MNHKFNTYLQTWTGVALLKQHQLDEFGLWEIRGEDANADFGGPHYEPYIATVQSTLKQAIEYAVNQNNFWTWGGGGSIKKITLTEI
jgi:hypothetical protein